MMLGSKTFALTVTRKNPFQIGCADRIFAFYSKFSYGQRSKCADLLNSYSGCYSSIISNKLICSILNSDNTIRFVSSPFIWVTSTLCTPFRILDSTSFNT